MRRPLVFYSRRMSLHSAWLLLLLSVCAGVWSVPIDRNPSPTEAPHEEEAGGECGNDLYLLPVCLFSFYCPSDTVHVFVSMGLCQCVSIFLLLSF